MGSRLQYGLVITSHPRKGSKRLTPNESPARRKGPPGAHEMSCIWAPGEAPISVGGRMVHVLLFPFPPPLAGGSSQAASFRVGEDVMKADTKAFKSHALSSQTPGSLALGS